MAESLLTRVREKLSSSVSEAGMKFSDVFKIVRPKTGATYIWTYEGWGEPMEDQWPAGFESVLDAYKRIALVRQCINTSAHFATRKGFTILVEPLEGREGDEAEMERIENKVNSINRRVNADLMWYIGVVKRDIHGRSAFEIVRGARTKEIMMLLPLTSSIKPIIDEKTMTITGYKHGDTKLDVDEVVYFPLDALDPMKLGLSKIDTIRRNINIKINLEKDLKNAAKRLWAPIGIFQIDTAGVTGSAEKEIELNKFKEQLIPGRSIVSNKAIDSKIVDLKPDLGALVRSIEKQDEEIMGNWNMPKALLGREKTLTKSTLEFSLRALYEGPIAGVQREFKRLIEEQFYRVILKDMGMDKKYRVKHLWRPVILYDPALIRSLAYAVGQAAMSKREMFEIMDWEILDEPDEQPTEKPEEEPKGKPEKPEDVVQQALYDEAHDIVLRVLEDEGIDIGKMKSLANIEEVE